MERFTNGQIARNRGTLDASVNTKIKGQMTTVQFGIKKREKLGWHRSFLENQTTTSSGLKLVEKPLSVCLWTLTLDHMQYK
jgi:hypothetical protein